LPQIEQAGTDPWILILTVKYLDKSFNAFDEMALKRPGASLLMEHRIRLVLS